MKDGNGGRGRCFYGNCNVHRDGVSWPFFLSTGVFYAERSCAQVHNTMFNLQVKEGTRNWLVHLAICTLPPIFLFGAGMLGRGNNLMKLAKTTKQLNSWW